MLKKQTIEIVTPARLHFGFLELNKNINSFGGIGLSIDKFNTKIKLIIVFYIRKSLIFLWCYF